MEEKIDDKQPASLTLNEGRCLFIYEGEEVDFLTSSNIPHLNVEDHKDWESHSFKENPNLIGQIHRINDEVVFHLCFNPSQKRLTKGDLRAIIKGIEYVENFIKNKEKAR